VSEAREMVPASGPPEPNGFSVRVALGDGGWEVRVLDAEGQVAWTRYCDGEADARTFASTVQQHIYWLSPAKFKQYYRLSDPT